MPKNRKAKSVERPDSREPLFSVTTSNGLVVETFRSGGKGGQNQNKRDTGVRIRHEQSGATGESREERSQLQNKRTALKRLAETPQFRFWVHQRVKEIDREQSIEEWVEAQMADLSAIKVEYKDDSGRWVEVE